MTGTLAASPAASVRQACVAAALPLPSGPTALMAAMAPASSADPAMTAPPAPSARARLHAAILIGWRWLNVAGSYGGRSLARKTNQEISLSESVSLGWRRFWTQ